MELFNKEEINWMLEHWWVFAILMLASALIIVYTFIEATRFYTESQGPLSAITSFKFWKWFFKCCFCTHKNAKIIDYDGHSIMVCPDCGIKAKV